MSIHTIEQALFEIASGPARAAQYKQDPQVFLAAYPLSDQEKTLILSTDVYEMIARSANPMLVMRAFTAVEGRERLPEYLRRLRQRDDIEQE
ncbi:MAG: hypothetical protein J0I25_06405 [Sphingomonadales bacterium]|nr:hypothetical protein [Sphingomonadales bacterium]